MCPLNPVFRKSLISITSGLFIVRKNPYPKTAFRLEGKICRTALRS